MALLELAKRDSEERKRSLQIVQSSGLEIGSTGLEVFGGIITGDIAEHNRAWMDQERFTTVDLMRRGDSTVAATLSAITLPALAAGVTISGRTGPNGEEAPPQVQEAGEFVHDLLFTEGYMSTSWAQFLREAYLHLAYGHYVFEKVFSEIKSGRWAGKIGWRKFAPRHPSTVERWHFDKNGGKRGLDQRVSSEAAKTSEEVFIPIEKLLVFTNQEEAGNPLGISVLRPGYKHWKFKDGFYAVQAIAIERQGAGVPFAEYPQGTPDLEKDKAEEMLQNIQAHEQSYFLYAEDWEVGFVNMGGATTYDPQRAIEHHDTMIAKAVLAAFMNLPQDSRGSFALSENQTDFFNHSLQSSADYVAGIMNRHAIPQICDMNFPGLDEYPVLKFDRIGHLSTDRILEAINNSVEQGTLTPDLDLENRVRVLLNLPPIKEEEFDEAKEEEAALLAPPELPAPGGAEEGD